MRMCAIASAWRATSITSSSVNASASSPSSSRHRRIEIGSGMTSAHSGTSMASPTRTRFVIGEWRARARRCGGRRAAVGERGCGLSAGIDPRELCSERRRSRWSCDHRSNVQLNQGAIMPLVNAASWRCVVLRTRHRQRLRIPNCDVVKGALETVPWERRPNARSGCRCGEPEECRAALRR